MALTLRYAQGQLRCSHSLPANAVRPWPPSFVRPAAPADGVGRKKCSLTPVFLFNLRL